MEHPVTDLVCAIRDKVAERIGSNPYRTWFGGSTEFTLDGGRLSITVANPFVGNWISSNYMDHLVGATRDVIGAEPSVVIDVVSNRNDAPAADARRAPRRSVPTDGRPKLRGRLDSYVVGPCNELAYSVVTHVARTPGDGFKHVVLHSGCGLGKTHLLQGLCAEISQRHPTLHWRYLSGEEFTNEYIYAVRNNRVDAFRTRFRNVDVLVIDDIHFLANKKATQEEFLHTFNAIDACGKTVALSTDRHPRAIASLNEPLIDRLVAATVVRIDPPDFATRREILRRRAQAMLVTLSDEVLDLVARQVTRNVRELEGALFKLAAYSSLSREPLGLELAQRAIEDYIGASRQPEAREIERLVAAHFGVSRDALHSASRDRTVTTARGIAMYLIRRHTPLSFPEIGRMMGNKQHSTVLMAVRRIQDILDRDGAVTWKTPAGLREVAAKRVLDEVEQRLVAADREV